jgi:hypothetical protein
MIPREGGRRAGMKGGEASCLQANVVQPMRGLREQLAALIYWDPCEEVDCHTTDGSFKVHMPIELSEKFIRKRELMVDFTQN